LFYCLCHTWRVQFGDAYFFAERISSVKYATPDSYAKGHCYAVALINIDKGKIVDIGAGGKTTAKRISLE